MPFEGRLMGVQEVSELALGSWVRALRMGRVSELVCEAEVGVKAVGWCGLVGSELWGHGAISRVWGERSECGW